MKYETYDPARTCVKCGCADSSTEFKKPIHLDRPDKEPLVKPACLRRRCLRCGYTWNELPLDESPVKT